jgi:cytochrome c biogenesis protein CcmG/thiol:disulfide interchange protein DsbE
VTPQKTRTLFLVVGLALIAGLATLLGSGFGTDPHAIRSTMIRQDAPKFELTNMDGQPVTLESLRGKPVVLNFWSTWCGPCKAEHPLFQGAAKQHPDVQFLGVVYSDTTDKVRRYFGI